MIFWLWIVLASLIMLACGRPEELAPPLPSDPTADAQIKPDLLPMQEVWKKKEYLNFTCISVSSSLGWENIRIKGEVFSNEDERVWVTAEKAPSDFVPHHYLIHSGFVRAGTGYSIHLVAKAESSEITFRYLQLDTEFPDSRGKQKGSLILKLKYTPRGIREDLFAELECSQNTNRETK